MASTCTNSLHKQNRYGIFSSLAPKYPTYKIKGANNSK